ncbi:hypothetical protein [Labilibaculum sp.]|uniref:hypothetical protein n=1 Tax=Labilibaculum sp. TaxID=2060723 RepID=UPI00356A9D9D
MKKIILCIAVFASILVACEDEETATIISQGDYPVKEYYLERDPKVNVWGAGMDFIHSECSLSKTDLDYEYMTDSSDFSYDIKFYIVKAYYYDDNGDLQNEGCPAMLLSEETKACKMGEGVSYFDSLTLVTEDMISLLENDPAIDYSLYKDETTGFYDQESLYTALDSCIIGQSFRSDILVVPDGMTEEEVQAVYLVKTKEGGYAKFMMKEYKPDAPNQKQSLVRWQVISE